MIFKKYYFQYWEKENFSLVNKNVYPNFSGLLISNPCHFYGWLLSVSCPGKSLRELQAFDLPWDNFWCYIWPSLSRSLLSLVNPSAPSSPHLGSFFRKEIARNQASSHSHFVKEWAICVLQTDWNPRVGTWETRFSGLCAPCVSFSNGKSFLSWGEIREVFHNKILSSSQILLRQRKT